MTAAVKNVTKYYSETADTPKGHMIQIRKNIGSTKFTSGISKGGHNKKLKTTTVVDVRSQVKAQNRGARGTSVSAIVLFQEPNTTQLKGLKGARHFHTGF